MKLTRDDDTCQFRISCCCPLEYFFGAHVLSFPVVGVRGRSSCDNSRLSLQKMDILTAITVFILSVILQGNVEGYFINIDAHAEECFFDKVQSGTKMSLMFEVAEGGFLDIDVSVSRRTNATRLLLYLNY